MSWIDEYEIELNLEAKQLEKELQEMNDISPSWDFLDNEN